MENTLYDVLILAGGLVLLIKGADYFVQGSSGLALMLGVSPLFIGLTLVAFGTSAPEAAVSIQASLKGANSISLGNIIGSNIANVGLVLGFTALFRPIPVPPSTVIYGLPFVIGSTIILGIMMFFPVDPISGSTYLEKVDGIILTVLFLLFFGYALNMAKNDRKKIDIPEVSDRDNVANKGVFKLVLFLCCGLIAIIYGGDLVVESSINLATDIGVSEKFIAVTIIAIGTSLPELVTSLVAALKKEDEIALGNIVGSCIFNILLVLGVSASFNKMFVEPSFKFDITVSLVLVLIVFFFAIRWKKVQSKYELAEKSINRFEGILLLLIYVGYIGYIIYRL